MNSVIPMRAQIAAIAFLRWRMFVNGLRNRRGKMELASRIIVTAAFAFGGLSGFIVAAGFSWYLVAHGQTELLPVILWPIFFFWQFFPVMATAFTNNPDSSELLRFPLTYRSFFLIRLGYGFFDPASALGSVGIFGVLLGTTIARPPLFPWTVLILFTFALFNLLLMQTVFAWLERWLAQRRTREVMGVLFILVMLSFQLIGPMTHHFGRRRSPQFSQVLEFAAKAQGALPPGLAAAALNQATHGNYATGVTSLLLLGVITAAVAYLLHLRLRRQFRGENLSEAAGRPKIVTHTRTLQLGWNIPGLPDTVAAVFEKEVRYLARSGPMLLTLIMPLFMLIIFRVGPASSLRHSGFFGSAPDMALPSATAYALLVLSNLVYNSFGGDAAGLQFFFASPATFQDIVLGKNLMHTAIVAINTALVWIAVTLFYGPPQPAVLVATLAGILFAVPLNFAAGNLLSLYSPRKRDFATFGRQNASQMTVLASLGMQAAIVGIGIGTFALARHYQNLWIAALMFCALAVVSITVYVMILHRINGIAVKRREVLLAELCRA